MNQNKEVGKRGENEEKQERAVLNKQNKEVLQYRV